METKAALPTGERIREALCSVDDPEVGMNIVDLGLVYRIDIAPDLVLVEPTMATPACLMGDPVRISGRIALRLEIAPITTSRKGYRIAQRSN